MSNPFPAGTRVLITGRRHPVFGHVGTIVGDPFVPGILVGRMWRVEVDGMAGHQCGIREDEAEEIRAAATRLRQGGEGNG